MKRTAKLAAVLTIGATTAAGVVIAISPVSATAGGNGPAATSPGSAMMRGGNGTGSDGGSGTGIRMGMGTGAGMMGGYGTGTKGCNGAGIDMGAIMGRALQNASGTHVSIAQATAEATAIPPGASIDAARNQLTFTGGTVALTLVTGLEETNPYAFQVAGMTNPQIIIPVGARVTLRLINADTDAAHGVLVTATSSADTSRMPMMTSTLAAPGAAIWALGEANDTGASAATTVFTLTTSGTYTYLCPIPGHAQQGMHGTITVR